MPIEFLYLAIVFAVAILGFTLLKRPLYECMLAAFIVLVAVTGSWASIWTFMWKAITDSSLYVIIVFIISASLLSKTTVIDDFIAIILSIFGRFRGGAGFLFHPEGRRNHDEPRQQHPGSGKGEGLHMVHARPLRREGRAPDDSAQEQPQAAPDGFPIHGCSFLCQKHLC